MAGIKRPFPGMNLAHFGFLNLVIAAAFLLTAFRLVAYLQHIRRLPNGKEGFHCMREYPWLLLSRPIRWPS